MQRLAGAAFLALATLPGWCGAGADAPQSQRMVATVLPADVAATYGAACLDGTPPVYYLRRNRSDQRWLIFLEGGGWCFGPTTSAALEDCAERAGTPLGSSRTLDDVADYGGVLSANASINPDFHTWNAVFVHYCDGSSFGSSGRGAEPVAVRPRRGGGPQKLWMRGRANFDAVVAHLKEAQGMHDAKEVILSGGSAGGLAVFYNLDHLAELLPAGTRLTGFPDAGFFLDAPDHRTGAFNYRKNFQGADTIWNVTGGGGTNARCLAANPGSSSWKCLMAPYIVEYLETPVYIMNSAYDVYQLQQIDPNCVPSSQEPCSPKEIKATEAFGELFRRTVGTSLTFGAGKHGIYIDSCYVHEQNLDYCSTQSLPNCVGWSPKSPGSRKWGYNTSVHVSSVTPSALVTPQQAFSAFYFWGEFRKVLDGARLQRNPSCVFRAATPRPPPRRRRPRLLAV